MSTAKIVVRFIDAARNYEYLAIQVSIWPQIQVLCIGFHLNYGRWNPPRIRIEGVMVKAMKPALVIAIIGSTMQREIHMQHR